MITTTKEFEYMEFNPILKKEIAKVYPKIVNILGEIRDDRMVRYVLLMYDFKSPMRKLYTDLSKRKSFSASLAGYDLEKDDVSEIYEFKLKDGDDFIPHEELLQMVISYLQYQNNWVWSMIVSNEQAFYEYNKRVMMPVDGARDKDILQAISIKTQIMAAQDDIYQRLQKYYREMSGGDPELETAIVSRKRLRPEEVANNVQQNR